jgi:CrcB protein
MSGLRTLLLVGLGGFLGSIGRYLVGGWAQRALPLSTFPLGTLAVNVVGCFGIGALGALAGERQALGPELRTFLMLGVLGGFTTFSSFAHETLALGRDGEYGRALVNVALQVCVGLAAAWLGAELVRR